MPPPPCPVNNKHEFRQRWGHASPANSRPLGYFCVYCLTEVAPPYLDAFKATLT